MAKLKAATRNKLPKSDFGEPGKRAYPMPDRAHAANAKARASQMEAAGKLSEGEEAKIDAKANRILGKKGATDGMGAGRGGMAVHSSAKATGMHTDNSMHKARY